MCGYLRRGFDLGEPEGARVKMCARLWFAGSWSPAGKKLLSVAWATFYGVDVSPAPWPMSRCQRAIPKHAGGNKFTQLAPTSRQKLAPAYL